MGGGWTAVWVPSRRQSAFSSQRGERLQPPLGPGLSSGSRGRAFAQDDNSGVGLDGGLGAQPSAIGFQQSARREQPRLDRDCRAALAGRRSLRSPNIYIYIYIYVDDNFGGGVGRWRHSRGCHRKACPKAKGDAEKRIRGPRSEGPGLKPRFIRRELPHVLKRAATPKNATERVVAGSRPNELGRGTRLPSSRSARQGRAFPA